MKHLSILIVAFLAWLDCGALADSCDTLRGEAAVVRSVQSAVEFHTLSRAVSSTIVPVSVGTSAGLFAAGHINKDKYDATSGVVLLSAEVLTLGTTMLLKEVFHRPRPWRAHPTCISPGSMDDEYSFPSGHSSSAATLATYLSLRYPSWYVVAPAVLYAGYTWYARMNLGVHYPSDVITGALIGTAIGYAAYRLTETVQSKIEPVLPLRGVPIQRGFPTVTLRIPL